MKLLLSEEEIEKVNVDHSHRELSCAGCDIIAQAQLNHILNLDMKTTSELIVKLEARLDELYQKEVAK